MIKSLGKLFSLAFGNSVSTHSFHPTDKCPECGTSLMRSEEKPDWDCPNLDCPAQIRARIEHFCSVGAMDITGADAAFVKLLVERGLLRDVAELYRLKVKELAALPGMDNTSAQKLFDAITASQKRDAWRLLFGLAIPTVTPAAAQSLCAWFKSVDNVFAASAERLRQVEGISESTARAIVQWHSDGVNRKLVRRLFKAGVNFKA